MDALGSYLDEREKGDGRNHQEPAERLLRFDAWTRKELAARLDWAWAADQKERRIEQARVYLERMVLDLWRRGWLLDGKKLAARIVELLDAVGAYQRAGKVNDFWPYFRAAVDRYVGANAEEIQAEAMRAGSHIGLAMAAILKGQIAGDPRLPALPELVAQRAAEVAQAKEETLREKLARARARNAACKADAEPLPLFGEAE